MTNKQKRTQRDNMKTQRKQKYLTVSEQHFGMEEDLRRELAVLTFMMKKKAEQLGVTGKDLESPSKCSGAVYDEIARCFAKAMDENK